MAMPTWEEGEAVLDEIRPALRVDGGDVELGDIKEDGTVLVRMIGACSGCGKRGKTGGGNSYSR